MFDLLQKTLYKQEKAAHATLDSVSDKEETAPAGIGQFAFANLRMSVASAIQEWANNAADLGENESLADRFFALLVGIADEDKDGELTEEENYVVDQAVNEAYDYLVAKGIEEDDVMKLLENGDNAAAERIVEFLSDSLKDSDSDSDIENFAFSESDQEPALDAVYKKVFAIRGGKKVKIRKKISGTVRLTSKQKMAIRKAQRKAHSAGAMMRRMKSMRLRRRSGLK